MHGTSLVESAIALVLISIMVGMGIPRVTGLRDRLVVQENAHAIIVAYQRARMAALLGSGTALLRVEADRLTVWRLQGSDSSLTWQRPGPAADGVTLSGPSRLIFAPGGVTMGVANGRFVLSRGAISRSLVVSRLGRIRVETPRRVRRRRRSAPRCWDSS
jgi:Tfp pilus assembly protein FimT